jgi:hypothetical protein
MSLSFIKSFYLPKIFKTKNGDFLITVSVERIIMRGKDELKEKSDVFVSGANFDERPGDDVMAREI